MLFPPECHEDLYLFPYLHLSHAQSQVVYNGTLVADTQTHTQAGVGAGAGLAWRGGYDSDKFPRFAAALQHPNTSEATMTVPG